MIKEGFQWWPPRAFQGWPAILTRLTGWRWCVQSGVQAQSGDEGDGFAASNIQLAGFRGTLLHSSNLQGADLDSAFFDRDQMGTFHVADYEPYAAMLRVLGSFVDHQGPGCICIAGSTQNGRLIRAPESQHHRDGPLGHHRHGDREIQASCATVNSKDR